MMTEKAEVKEIKEEKPKLLIEKIIDAVKDIDPVTKDEFNSYQKYKYTSDAQVSSCIHKLAEHGVWFIPSFEIIEKWTQKNNKGSVNNFVQVQGTFTLTDGFDRFVGSMPGIGADSLDKAVYKAETGAKKNFFMQFLALTTEDTDDDHNKGLDKDNNNYGNQQNNSYQNRNNNYQNNRNQQQQKPRNANTAEVEELNNLINLYANMTGQSNVGMINEINSKGNVKKLELVPAPLIKQSIRIYKEKIDTAQKEDAQHA